ncbi:hypothetical protein [Streptomyces hygroscopicus]|uniref:hypothetical protein n=1 Tax=Streptomyces hygroscopicus TaxID=1912 RepID=UPI0037B64679
MKEVLMKSKAVVKQQRRIIVSDLPADQAYRSACCPAERGMEPELMRTLVMDHSTAAAASSACLHANAIAVS